MTRLYKGHLTGRVVSTLGRVQVVADVVLVQGTDRVEIERFLERSGDHIHVVAIASNLRRLHPTVLISTRVEYPKESDVDLQVDDLYGFEPEFS